MDGGLNKDSKISMIGRGRSRKLGINVENSTMQNSATETGFGRIGGYLRKWIGSKQQSQSQ